MEPRITEFLTDIAAACPELESIWLIGSRANGTSTDASDWDFLAFGSEATYACLQASPRLQLSGTDFLIVTDGDGFRGVWDGEDKAGSLADWEWKAVSDTVSEYTQLKLVFDREHQLDGVFTRRKAIRVWPLQ
jgi:hypothetical protein